MLEWLFLKRHSKNIQEPHEKCSNANHQSKQIKMIIGIVYTHCIRESFQQFQNQKTGSPPLMQMAVGNTSWGKQFGEIYEES